MLELLRKEDFGKDTKVILLTNLEPNSQIIERVIIDKPYYYFVKSDIKFADLLNKVNEVLA
jgi:hypothetical protein